MIPRYLLFHAVFVVPAIVLLWVVADRPVRHDDRLGLAILVPVALAYTVPWDGYLIRRGVWWYGSGSVAATVWTVPLGEYLFILLQPVLTGLWTSRFDQAAGSAGDLAPPRRAAGGLAGLAVGGVGLLLLSRPATFYLGAILAWGGPVLALQWAFDWPYLWRRRRTVLAGVAVPTVYLCLADRVAIEYGVWQLSTRFTTGLAVGGLPVEEATFFLVTNLFVVQGLVLFRGLAVRAGRDDSAARAVAGARR